MSHHWLLSKKTIWTRITKLRKIINVVLLEYLEIKKIVASFSLEVLRESEKEWKFPESFI